MPELGPYGSVRGARSNSRPYRDHRAFAPACQFLIRLGHGACVAVTKTPPNSVRSIRLSYSRPLNGKS